MFPLVGIPPGPLALSLAPVLNFNDMPGFMLRVSISRMQSEQPQRNPGYNTPWAVAPEPLPLVPGHMHLSVG